MRTKTLVLTALSSLSAFGLMAQTSTNVYSLNAVGYINVTVPPGFSIVADQLYASGGNYISNVINDTSGVYDGVGIFKWSGTAFTPDLANSVFAPSGTGGWTEGGNITLNPGEAAWIQNPNSTNLTFTFVGTVPQGTPSVTNIEGFNLISSPVPQAGTLSTVLGFTNVNNDDGVFVWTPTPGTNTGTFAAYSVSTNGLGTGYNSEWSPSEPSVNVGEGFWYQATAAIVWSRVFSVND